jgi:hypothetical protein
MRQGFRAAHPENKENQGEKSCHYFDRSAAVESL